MPVNDQPLYLMETGRMGGIHFIRAEYSSGSYHSDRQPALLHLMHLYARGLRTQQNISRYIERILFILGRMIRRNIQGLEIIIISLHLRTFHYLIPHAYKDTLHLFQHNGIRMPMSQLRLFGRKGYIDNLRLHLCLPDSPFDLPSALFQKSFDFTSGFVHHLTYPGPLFGSHVPHGFQQIRQFSLFPQDTYPDLVELVCRVAAAELRNSLFFDLFQLILHFSLISALFIAYFYSDRRTFP